MYLYIYIYIYIFIYSADLPGFPPRSEAPSIGKRAALPEVPRLAINSRFTLDLIINQHIQHAHPISLKDASLINCLKLKLSNPQPGNPSNRTRLPSTFRKGGCSGNRV